MDGEYSKKEKLGERQKVKKEAKRKKSKKVEKDAVLKSLSHRAMFVCFSDHYSLQRLTYSRNIGWEINVSHQRLDTST